MLSSHEAGSDDFWLAAALRAKTAGSPVLLPPERITASWQTFAAEDEALLRGAGAAQTELAIAGLPDAVVGGMPAAGGIGRWRCRSEEHTSELQSLMRISYAVCCLQKKKTKQRQ